VICTACHHSNDNNAKFCDQCGGALEVRCPACDYPVRVEARFCSQCGQRLEVSSAASQVPAEPAVPSVGTLSLDDKLDHLQRYVPQHLAEKILANRGRLEGERKLVTVLFADLAGYTALSEQLGEEALFAIMDELYEVFIHQVHRFEGTVNELTGDGLVAFFGAPLAVEQAPQRAVRAALALQEAAAQFRSRLAPEQELHLHLRIGINTGPVIVGTIGNDLRMDYKAVGSTVNLAARMEQTATPGSIQITAQTHRLIEGYFDCEDLGLTTLKGAATRVRVYQVTGEQDVRSRIDVARERGFTRLVGRERELDLLRHCFDLVQKGRGQAVSIIGDAGLGKSRLLYECRQILADTDLTWLDGRCHPYGMALAYLPIVDWLKQHFRLDANDQDQDIKRKVYHGLEALNADPEATAPYVLHLLAAETGTNLPAGMSPEAVKHRIFETLRWLVLETASQRPLVIAIEDLHWVDRTTAEFLTFVLDHIAGARILLVCTHRPDFVSTWSRKSYHSVLTLTRLDPQDAYQMLTSLLGTSHIQDDLAALVLDKAEGVPFFLEELVHSLRETGAIELHEEAWRLAARDTALQVPDTVDEVLMARIDRLPEGAKRVLQMGAVIGREFAWELLREVSGLTEWELIERLAALTEAELIYERGLPPQATYMFKHAFTQEAAYRSLLTAQRRTLHHRVAVTLETLFPDRLEEYYGQLAHHFLEAAQRDEVDKAIEYAVRAGNRNMALPAYAEAVRFYQLALEALARQKWADETQRCELLLALGEAQQKAGEFVQALHTLQQAAQSAKGLGLPEMLARVVLNAEWVIWYGKLPPEPVAGLLEDALRELEAEDRALRARVLGGLARTLSLTGAQQGAAQYGQQAVDMARRLGEPGTLAYTLNAKLYLPWRPEDVEQRLIDATEMLRLAEEVRDDESIHHAHYWRMHSALEIGDIQTYDTVAEIHAQMSEARQEPFYVRNSKAFQAMRALMRGDFAASEALAQQALSIGQRLQFEDTAGAFGLQMFTICREQGRLKEFEPAVKHFVQQHGAASTWRPGLALIYSEFGRQREARREFEHLAQHDFADFPRDALWLTCITYLAEICTFLGDAARAVILYPLLLPYAGRNIVVGGGIVCYGAASRYLGMLAATMGHWQEAEQHFEDALAMNARMGARPWLAHTQHDYATMLLARHQPGDHEKAASLLHEALTTARELGMHALENRITAGTHPEMTPLPTPLTDLDDLSPREIEVLRLMAAGKSNREIADALFISLNTVATHVRNILTKTGCTNRTEAAAYAMRHGLLAE
jgi:class 3 adenylate cyclase/DNA-binding CsgD family transcriptional regulator